jgi:hypothetical protein
MTERNISLFDRSERECDTAKTRHRTQHSHKTPYSPQCRALRPRLTRSRLHVGANHGCSFSLFPRSAIRGGILKLSPGHGALPPSVHRPAAQELGHPHSTLGGKKRFTLYYSLPVIFLFSEIIIMSSF